MCLLIYQRAGGDAGGNFALAGSQLQAGHISDPSISTYQFHSWDLDTIYGRAGHAKICLAMRRRNNVIELEGQDKMSRSRCLNGVATANIDILQEPKMLWPKKT